MNDQDYNKQFGQEPDFSGVRVAIAMVLLVAVTLIALWSIFAIEPAHAETCPQETQEARITEAIAPGDKVWVFTASGLETFLQGLRNNGLMIGIPITDKVYVTFDHYYSIFFLNGGCIVQYYPQIPPSMLERVLPK